MVERTLGRTGMRVRPVGFGAWAIGGFWGTVDDAQSMRALHAAIDSGVNFIDTADVYGDGRSERLVGQLVRERPGETIYVATKAGRKLPQQVAGEYSKANLAAWVDESLRNLNAPIDLLQLHCPPRDLYDRPEVFGALDDLVSEGKIRNYGVSVETVDEALVAIRYPAVQSVQIIFNLFRTKPSEVFFPEAARQHVGIIARVPLASGLLTGKLRRDSTFSSEDHRQFNRHGEMFDKGETFSGVPYDVGLEAVDELRRLVPAGATLAQFALRWILMFDAVTCVIPGAKTPEQARDNTMTMELGPLTPAVTAAAQDVYDRLIRGHVHAGW